LTSPVRRALLSQALGAALAGGLILTVFPALPAQPLTAAGLQGLSAAAFSLLLRSPVWWLPIHLGFMPLAILALGLGLPSWVWLAGFALLLLTFWRTDRSRVPLYLSNRPTADALAALLPAAPVATWSTSVAAMAACCAGWREARPDCRFVGYEHAPLPYAMGQNLLPATAQYRDPLRRLLVAAAGRLRAGLCLSLARPDAAPVGQGQE
jgi:hypothetical protein